MGGMNPRQMSQMMKKLGIDVRELDDVEEVVVRTPARDYVFKGASVSVMKAQGVETWQISGQPEVVERAPQITDEDVQTVIDQTGCDAATARATLEETKGDLAEAILKIAES